jgi:hypothetical protein
VELALGLLVFVTILVFGIYFAEIGYMSVKVTEANSAALWHATAAQMHELPGDFTKLDNLINNDIPGNRVTTDYADFDGRSSNPGGNPIRQVFSNAHDLQVTCQAGGPSFAPVATTDGVFTDTGGMTCTAQGVIEAINFPESFLDQGQGAFFQVRHFNPFAMTICGVNRGGGCQAGFAILLDDWGLATRDELKECKVLDGSGCDNKPFYDSTELVYNQHVRVTGAALSMAQQTVGAVPGGYNPRNFYHSFRGAGGFTDQENGGDADPGSWVTTPGASSPTTEYITAYNNRQNCWPGKRC